MNQPETLPPHRFSLIPGNITRLFLLLMVLLLISLGVIMQNAVNVWLRDKSSQITLIAQQLHKRIEAYRYVTWQVYDNVAENHNDSDADLQQQRLRPDIYYLQKARHKTEVIIYGSHERNTLAMGDHISSYLDTLWGSEQIPWSMYYLNGQDNSLILVSTLPLKERTSSFQEPDMRSLLESRRSEMLQQANTLDVRESFSGLRFINWQNSYYLTLRTTFNQPGQLATVLAFDLPISDIVPPGLSLADLKITSNTMPFTADKLNEPYPDMGSAHINFNGSHIEISSPIITSRLNLFWQISLTNLLTDTLQDSLIPLLMNIILLGLVLFGYTTFRYPATNTEISENNNALHILRALNEEIIALLPVGLLVYDKEVNRIVFSNKIADHLLPHLDLGNISILAEQHQGVIQATINNELYEVRLFYSQITPNTQIFILRDQDREILINSRLKQARQLYEINQRGRSNFMHHLSGTLQQPLSILSEQIAAMPREYQQPVQESLRYLTCLAEQIQLVSTLENNDWRERSHPFTIQQVLDDLVLELLPDIRRKGLKLLVNNTLPAGEIRYGDCATLRIILIMLLKYAIITTQIGRITLNIEQHNSDEQRLSISLRDTGNGLSDEEAGNMHFPFFADTSEDDYGKASGLTFFLCNLLAAKLRGNLMIKPRPGLGTHYLLTVILSPQTEDLPRQELLLDGMVVLVDVCADEVREVVTRWLSQRGAQCIQSDEKVTRQPYDMYFTDNPSNLTASGILLSDDENGVRHYGAGKWRVNFNISNAMQEAVLQLIEEQLVLEDASGNTNEGQPQTDASDYYPLFAETVPADLQKLYTEFSVKDFVSMAKTAHRLKGVFAMLNLLPGKQSCETLEQHIRENDVPAIEKDTSDLDLYVNRLLSQGSLYE